MNECVFCKIVSGQHQAQKIYEDDLVIAFLDHRPIRRGHTLVIPKTHYETILDIPDEDLAYLIQVVKKLAGHIKKRLEATGLRVSNNNYASARQMVPHIHFHIIPTMGKKPFKLKLGRIPTTAAELKELAKSLWLK
jgi:histidine triad (HIT) family protein